MAWTIEVGTSPRSYKKITFKRSLDSAPTSFSATIKYYSDINYWDVVEIKNGGTTEWYGYIEKKKIAWDENGRYMEIGGRCRKVILWKKWTERFTDTRINGFFGSVEASELIKFLIRCPVSDSPVDEVGNPVLNHKIGWGIKPSDLTVRASPTTTDTDPDWVKARYVGLAWRNRGKKYNGITLDVNSVIAGPSPWAKTGGSPYIDDAGGEPEDANKISTTTVNAYDDFGFPDLSATATGINSVRLNFWFKTATPVWLFCKAVVEIYMWRQSDSSWVLLGTLHANNKNYRQFTLNAIGAISTVSDVNNTKVRFKYKASGGINLTAHITYCWLNVNYSDSGSQDIGDYFVVDLTSSTDVMGMLIESRKNSDQFAKNYEIKYSDADTPDPANDGDWIAFPTAISVANNVYRDILHSWKPTTLRHIRIKITDDKFAFDTVLLKIEARLVSGASATLQAALYDGIGWQSWSDFATYTSSDYEVKSKDVTSFLTTSTKIDAARLTIQTKAGPDEIRITHAYLELQKDGIVTAILDVDAWVNMTNEWTKTGANPYINSSDGDINCITSVDDGDTEEDLYYTFKDSTIDKAWEISQIYVYKAEDLKYRVVLDGVSAPASPPPYLGGPYLGTISPDANFDTSIENVNLPFGRLIDAINAISKRLHSSYIPFEWWIDIDDGEIHLEDHKGTDLSGTISFIKGTNLGGSTKEDDVSKTAQRVRYVGKSESKKQDDISSDWKLSASDMDDVRTFYEEVASKKTVDVKDVADLLANIHVTENAPPEEMIVCTVTNDTYAVLDYDVGDDVEIVDSLTGVSGAHRIHTIKKVITQDGCIVTLYLDVTYLDVENEWSRIHKKFRQLELTGTAIEDWLAEGSMQGKAKDVSSDTETFEKTARNDDEKPPADKTDLKWQKVGDGVAGQVFSAGERWMSLEGTTTNDDTLRTLEAWIDDTNDPRIIYLDQNPKLVCEFKIHVSGTHVDWLTDHDYWTVMVASRDAGGQQAKFGMGFGVDRVSGAGYRLLAILRDGVVVKSINIIEGLDVNKKYRIEAIVDWESRIVKYYFQDPDSPSGELKFVGLLTMDQGVNPKDETMFAIYTNLVTKNDYGAGQNAKIYIYKFRSEWISRQ